MIQLQSNIAVKSQGGYGHKVGPTHLHFVKCRSPIANHPTEHLEPLSYNPHVHAVMKWEHCYASLADQSLSLPRFGHSAVATTDANGNSQVVIYGNILLLSCCSLLHCVVQCGDCCRWSWMQCG